MSNVRYQDVPMDEMDEWLVALIRREIDKSKAATYTAVVRATAATYAAAIAEAGDEIDRLWGNGNWSLLSCAAKPAGFDFYDWDFTVEWHGLIPAGLK